VALRITAPIKNGKRWCHIDQSKDVRAFLADSGIKGVKTVGAPMHNKAAIMHELGDPLGLVDVKKCQLSIDAGSVNDFVNWAMWHLGHTISRDAQFNAAPAM